MVAPVNVTGGYLRPGQVVATHRQVPTVVGPAADPLDRAGQGRLQLHDLAPAGRRVSRVGWRLALHPQVPAGHLHHPVGLAGHHEGVLGQADVEALATSPQGQQEPVRSVPDHRADRQRTLDHAHGPPEGLAVVVAGSEVGGTQGGHDLGIGGDLGRHAEALRDHQVDVVVHVTVLDSRDHS